MTCINATNVTSFRDHALEQLRHETTSLLKIIDHISPDKFDFTPHPKSTAMGPLAWHCATGVHWFVEAIRTGAFGNESVAGETPTTPGQLHNQVAALLAKDVGILENFPPEVLLKETPFCDGSAYRAIEYIHWGIWHLIHHRGQLSTYLRLAGAKVPAIYGPSADDMLGMQGEG
jgi:uncharacterized damage-inducible protein DinB